MFLKNFFNYGMLENLELFGPWIKHSIRINKKDEVVFFIVICN